MHPEIRRLLPVLRHARSSLWQHRLRSLLSTLGIACGVTSFMVMTSIGEGAKRETLAQIEQLGMKNTVIQAASLTPEQEAGARRLGSMGLVFSDAERLRQAVAEIDEVAMLRELKQTAYAYSKEFLPQVLATTPNLIGIQGLGLAAGRFLVESDLSGNQQVCVLGHRISKELGEDGKPGGVLRLENSLYRVVGVLKPMSRKSDKNGPVAVRDFDGAVFVPLDRTIPSVSELILSSRTPEEVLPALPLIKRVMEVTHLGAEDYRIVVPQELLHQAEQTRSTFNILLASVALISLLAGGIGIMNIMLASIAERVHEIGIGRALGATRESILMQFLMEALLLTGVGGMTGALLGVSGIGAVSLFADWRICLTPQVLFLPLLMAAGVGLAFGIYPAVRASRMDPVEALRH